MENENLSFPQAEIFGLVSNTAAGKEVFSTKCIQCHQMDLLGMHIGPNLTHISSKLDKVGLYENNEISFEEFLSQCKELLHGRIKQFHLAADLFAVLSNNKTKYFEFETKHKALARSDSFLFTLVDLDLSDEWVKNFLPLWYSLARPILLLDDFKDLEEDRLKQDENMILELGDDANAVMQAYDFGMRDLAKLATVNPKLARYIEDIFKKSLAMEHIRKMLT